MSQITVRSKSIMTKVAPRLVNQALAGEYPRGSICLTVWHFKPHFDQRLSVYRRLVL